MKHPDGLVVGIDASRCRSGGARAHLVGILKEFNPEVHAIKGVHLWSFKALLDVAPDRPWLTKHSPLALDGSLWRQLKWQMWNLPKELTREKCDILFTADASTLCRFKPQVVLSQDMLSYEPGVMRYFGWGFARWRLWAILYLQNYAFRCASGVIFLTQYAGKVIQKCCGVLSNIAYIPHGLGENFKQIQQSYSWPMKGERPIRCLYVSNAEMYKHQWVVVRAIEALRDAGHDVKLILIGGGAGKAQQLLERQIALSDPKGDFVQQLAFVSPNDLPAHLANTDIFVFASSCENMPNTLIEAMAAGLPIACSNRGPMPEVLGDGGVYFDPEIDQSIAAAVECIITDEAVRLHLAQRARALSQQYSWARCADETFAFVVDTYNEVTPK